ncbi:hypothetical protein [Saccharopolyspora griseoalba]|uniref:Uncharacterized protein n=1 Tax=Saccharopolyspora griseoalba TaxID=1431848 RepID=A0ABW2LLJ8_9PSEU
MGSVKDEPQTPIHGERTTLTCADARGVAARRLGRSYRAPANNEEVPVAGGRRNPTRESGTDSEMIEKIDARHARWEEFTPSVKSDNIFVSDLSRRLGL